MKLVIKKKTYKKKPDRYCILHRNLCFAREAELYEVSSNFRVTSLDMKKFVIELNEVTN